MYLIVQAYIQGIAQEDNIQYMYELLQHAILLCQKVNFFFLVLKDQPPSW